jgi:hypothetical protein
MQVYDAGSWSRKCSDSSIVLSSNHFLFQIGRTSIYNQ